MIELTIDEMNRIAKYYENATDSCIQSVLQGYMGRAFVEDKSDCTLSILLQGDFVFPSGDEEQFDEAKAKKMLEEFRTLDHSEEFLYVPQSEKWHDFLKKQEDLKIIQRYTLSKMKLSDFDVSNLNYIAGQLPEGYQFARITESIYEQMIATKWSEDNVNNFKSASDFVNRGFGIVILQKDKVVCAASSYTVYDRGVEVEIATDPEYRRQGLATMCGARFVLECIKENKVPNWDAANMMSVHIAKKLGYTFLGEYDTFVLK
ncbi:MAG: GNAT family N-acetyltransferase [Clostridiales bacterium]|nr:GNAT family N-acetyltransferase [Clostridiales bacterium]